MWPNGVDLGPELDGWTGVVAAWPPQPVLDDLAHGRQCERVVNQHPTAPVYASRTASTVESS